VKWCALAALCTALECIPNDLLEVDTHPVDETGCRSTPRTGSAEGGCSARPVNAAGLITARSMAKKQRDRAGRRPIGIIGPEYSRLCWRKLTEEGEGGVPPAAGKQRGSAGCRGPVRAVLVCLHAVRTTGPPQRDHLVPGLPAQGPAAGCPAATARCGHPVCQRARTGWCSQRSRSRLTQGPPRGMHAMRFHRWRSS
jgi:hypothetical protein